METQISLDISEVVRGLLADYTRTAAIQRCEQIVHYAQVNHDPMLALCYRAASLRIREMAQ